MPVRRFNDGTYHVEGDLVLASKDRQFFTFKNVLPLLKILGGKNVIFVSPMPRFLYEPCCGDDDHTTNRLDPEYEEEMRRSLNECRCNIKSFLFSNQVKTRVIDPSPVLPHHDADGEDIWGGDPVHPLPQGYRAIVDLLLAEFATFNTGSKKRPCSEGGGSLAKKPREAQRRPAWVEEDTSTAIRNEWSPWRGQRGGRGGQYRGRGAAHRGRDSRGKWRGKF